MKTEKQLAKTIFKELRISILEKVLLAHPEFKEKYIKLTGLLLSKEYFKNVDLPEKFDELTFENEMKGLLRAHLTSLGL